MFKLTRVVVTGADGFIGSHMVQALLMKGYEVLAVDLKFNRLKETDAWSNSHLQTLKLDITDKNLSRFIEKDDKVLHLAAVSSFAPAEEDPQQAVRINVEGTVNVILACLEQVKKNGRIVWKRKADRFVFSSTGSVLDPKTEMPAIENSPRKPTSIYGLSKKDAEDWIIFWAKFTPLPYVILRYAFVYGNGKDWGAIGVFLKKIRNKESPVVFGGRQSNDFIYIKDLVQANLLALETQFTNQIFNVGTGDATSIKDVCKYCLKATESDLQMKIEPSRVFDYQVFVYNMTKANTLLRFHPKWNVLDGIRDMVK